MHSFSITSENPAPLNYAAIQWAIDNFEIHTFNGYKYDLPMMRLAMAGYRPRQLKAANDLLIVGKIWPSELEERFPAMAPLWPQLDHVDLMEVAPGVALGLKLLMGRMHAPNLQDLPFDPNVPMAVEMRQVTDDYCGNDLHGTHMLGDLLKERLELRRALTARYGVDVRSKSDAQIAETVFKSQIGRKVYPRRIPHGFTFGYTPPQYLRFTTPLLQSVFATVCAAQFPVFDTDQVGDDLVGPDGKKIKTGVKMPAEIKALRITIGGSTYQMGIGGLHSTEKEQVVQDVTLHDVASYYPSLILNSGMYPEQLGPVMLDIYRAIYDGRLKNKALAKHLSKQADRQAEYQQVKSDEGGEKIILNGTFGKLFSKYSILFAPEQGVWVTITGQLALLMLIEAMECAGISVVSANTDGIVAKCPPGREWLRDAILQDWQQRTGLVMETDRYRAIYSASVNSYVGVGEDGSVTRKGDFKKTGVIENGTPAYDIATDAAVAYLTHGTPVHETLGACNDLRQFLAVRKVKGGGEWEGQFLGKVVRWYLSTTSTSPIRDSKSGNKVAGTDNCRPCMRLAPGLPYDIDRAAYAQFAIKLIERTGVKYEC